MLHETLPYLDSNFKIIVRKETHLFGSRTVWAHWHESIEFIYVTKGQALINRNGIEQIYGPGDLIIFNSNEIHSIRYQGDSVTYHCLIVDLSICNVGPLPPHSINTDAIMILLKVIEEFTEKQINYREAVIGGIKLMQSILSRETQNYDMKHSSSRKQELVKKAIDYMYNHFQENISLEDISAALHHNKHYLCHIFKEVTGRTVLTHLNFIRCDHARSLLASGKYSVTESAYASGFSNLPHFSQTYKSLFNHTPASDIKSYYM